MKDSLRFNAVLLLAFLSLIWGTSFILIKQGLKVFAPDEVGALRVTSASLFLIPLAIVKLRELKSAHYGRLFLSGLLGIFFPAFLFAIAQTRLDSSVTGIINSLTPMFTLIVGAVVFGVSFSRRAIIGMVIGLVGVVILIWANSGGHIAGINLYALFVILASIFYACNLNYIKFKLPDLGSLTITSVSLMLIGPLAMIYLLGFSDFLHKLNTEPMAWRAFGFVVLLGLMSTSVATILFNQLVKISTPLFTSSVTYIIPIIAVGWGVLDGEKLYAGHYIGMVAIIGGVYIASLKRS
jgi:drug/metabolite transporter (DMT)-like permease